jgi:uncharacterized protein YecT (DUF1311 family)
MSGYIKRSGWVVATLLGCLGLAVSAQGASFDCGKAQTKVEQFICSDAELSKLDGVMAIIFKDVLDNVSDPVAIKNAQRAWLKKRNGCSDATCVQHAYETRLEELMKVGETIKRVPKQTGGQVFPLNPKDPQSIPKGSPKPYELVMSKDKELCNHMLQQFNEDLAEHGWDGSAYHDRHEEFKSIPWEKARASYEADGRIHYTDAEGALFDFNNDGVQDFVVRDKGSLSGMRADEIFMLDASESKRANDLSYKELGKSKNVINIAGWGYPLSTPLDGQSEALWLLSPFKYRDNSYLFMRPVAVGYMSNFTVIAKYVGGKFVNREMTGKMEDICYYQQNGVKHGK